jgi:acyl-coenzyme A synthetase/AMP-(fatty) acid ligase
MPSKWLVQELLQFQQNTAITYQEQNFSYRDLYEKIRAIQNEVILDIEEGDVVAIVGDYSFNIIALLLALYENNNIIVPIASKVKSEIEDRLNESLSIFKINGDTLEVVKIQNKNKNLMIDTFKKSHHSGLVLFSSGSTGVPKAMIQDLDNLIDTYKGKRKKSMSMLVFLMFDHIGGLNTVFNALSIGATQILLDSREPEYICSLIPKYNIRILPSSPTFLNLMLISGAHRKFNLKSLRMVTYGTESMPKSLLNKLKSVFPKVKFLQTFGTSETGIASTSSQSSSSLYMKIDDPNLKYKIVNSELWLKSKTQILGYLNASMENFTDDGWFKTGDIVETIGDDYIKIVGRGNDVINVGGEKVMPAEVESVVMEISTILDCTCYGQENSITGQSVAIDVVLDQEISVIEVKKIIRKHCLNKLDRYKIPAKVRIVNNVNFSNRFKKIRKKS